MWYVCAESWQHVAKKGNKTEVRATMKSSPYFEELKEQNNKISAASVLSCWFIVTNSGSRSIQQCGNNDCFTEFSNVSSFFFFYQQCSCLSVTQILRACELYVYVIRWQKFWDGAKVLTTIYRFKYFVRNLELYSYGVFLGNIKIVLPVHRNFLMQNLIHNAVFWVCTM